MIHLAAFESFMIYEISLKILRQNVVGGVMYYHLHIHMALYSTRKHYIQYFKPLDSMLVQPVVVLRNKIMLITKILHINDIF